MLYTLNNIACKITPILMFRVCTKHMYEDNTENIRKNKHVNDCSCTE